MARSHRRSPMLIAAALAVASTVAFTACTNEQHASANQAPPATTASPAAGGTTGSTGGAAPGPNNAAATAPSSGPAGGIAQASPTAGAGGVAPAPTGGPSGNNAGSNPSAGQGNGANPSGSATAATALSPYEQTIVNDVERVLPAVVGIGVESQRSAGLGSGFIIDPNGFIVTNAHVVAGAQRVAVALADGRSFAGTVLGADPQNDLAMVKIDATGLPTVELGDSSGLRPGQTAIAIGNPLGFARTVTLGVVSATGRSVPEEQGQTPIQDMVQTSAPINPGNSGGPLLDSAGRVIGVNTLAAADPETGGAASGIGFAVSVNTVKRLTPGWMQQGQVTATRQPWIGVSVVDLTPTLARRVGLATQQGILVASVLPQSPADRAGLQAGDVITRIDGQQVQNADQLKAALSGKNPGDTVQVSYVRQGQGEQTAQVTIGGSRASGEAGSGGARLGRPQPAPRLQLP